MSKGEVRNCNYTELIAKMTPEVLAGLLTQNLYFNTCKFCTASKKFPCDWDCNKHVLEWLDQDIDENCEELVETFKQWKEIMNGAR